MPRRFPLSAKILCWFFVNLLLLAVMFYAVVRAQFRFGLDFLLSDRFDTAGDVIGAELAGEDRTQWDATLEQYSDAYHHKVRFAVFGGDAEQLAGESMAIPPEIREQLARRRGPPLGALHDDNPGPPPGPPAPPRRFIHSTNPSQYWVLKRTISRRPDMDRPMPMILVAESDSFTGGGLFFDLTPWIWVGLGAVLFSVLLWLPLVRDLNRAIAQLTAAANKIADGHFDVRVDQKRRDELGSLGRSINQMAGRLHDLVSGQKRFLGDVAHELCSPLAKLRVALGILDQQAAGDQKDFVAGAEEEAAHMANLVNELLSFSKASLTASNIQLQPVSLAEAAAKAVRREAAPPAKLEVNIPPELKAAAEPELLVRALSNLLRNAVQYAGGAGAILVSARKEGEKVLLTVADGGPGVPEAELARIFDPFYRVDASRDRTTGGAGLGLAIVKTCVESCGGTVSGRNRKPNGLEVTIQLAAA